MLTPIDQIANQNHLQLVKAALPYMQTASQKSLSVWIKMLELQNIMRFYDQPAPSIRACDTSTERPGILDMLSEMRNYCEGEEQKLLDQWIQIASTLELYSIFMQSSDDSVSVPEAAPNS